MDTLFDREHRDTAPEASPSPAASGSKPRPGFRWIPIRKLTARHRPRIHSHLLGLSERDRYLRFGYAASDAQIARYVEQLDFERDEVFGIFNRRLELIAMAHLAYAPAPQIKGQAAMAEFGVSVSKHARGRGLGARLFDHAILHARNRHISKLFIYALSENSAMLKIASNAGAKVERAGSESEAWLTLPPDDIASQVGEIVESQAAEWDYHMKVQAKRINEVIGTLFPVR